MNPIDRLLGGERVKLAGRKIYASAHDQAAARFLRRLSRGRELGVPTVCLPLIFWRSDFRRIIADRPLVGLTRCLSSQDALTLRLAIWLLGQLKEIDLVFLRPLTRHPSWAVRKEVAKTLRRLQAWNELESMRNVEPDERVRRICTRVDRPFAERMSAYLRRDVVAAPCGAPAPLRILAPIPSERHPPKAADYIRRILQRIAALVRGSPASGS